MVPAHSTARLQSSTCRLKTSSRWYDNWSHQLGNHSIEFGADLRYAMNHLVGLNNGELRSGNFIFHAAGTAGNAFGATPGSSGLGYGTFLLGDVSNFDRTQTQNTNAQERQKTSVSFSRRINGAPPRR